MPIKVQSHKEGGVEVPTMEEFNALAKRVELLERRLGEVEQHVVKDGDKVSLKLKDEFVTWMTQGGEIKSRGTSYIDEFQGWHIERR